MRKKAVFITNIPSPYRVDFFVYLQKNFPEYEFHVIFSGAGMENRQERMRKKAVFITNIPSPYRVDFFVYLQKNFPEYEFHVIFSGAGMENRQWSVELQELENAVFLKSRTIVIRKRYDDRYVFLPVGVEKTLAAIRPDMVFAMEYNPTILRAVHWCVRHHVPFVSWTDGTLYSERNIGRVQRLSRRYIIKRASAFVASSTASREAQTAYGADPKKCFLSYLRNIGRVQRLSRRYIIKRASAFVASSTASREAQTAYGADPKKCFLSYLTVDIEKYLAKKDSYGARQMIYVGSLIQRKGLDLLLPALAETAEDIRLVIVGEGQEKQALCEQMEKLGISDRVEWKGFVEGEALRKLYRASDVFVLPTREDCFGLVILEAMCASLPVISSKYADGARDLLAEGENGYMVDPEDTKAFAKTIDGIFAEGRLAQMGACSYERAQQFSFARVAEGCIAALRYVLGESMEWKKK